jgi:lysophospholipase L1-like esterase
MYNAESFSGAPNGTLESYNSWSKDTYATGSDLRIDTDRVRTNIANASTISYYKQNVTPPSADYEMQLVMQVDTAANANGYCMALVRMQTSGQSGTTCYGFGWTGSAWKIIKVVNGSVTVVTASEGSVSGPSLSSSTDYTIICRVEGSTITGFVDGNAIARHTDTAISTAGKPGFALSNSSVASTGRAYVTAVASVDINGDGTTDTYRFPNSTRFNMSLNAWDTTGSNATCICPGNSITFQTDSANISVMLDKAMFDIIGIPLANQPVFRLIVDNTDQGTITGDGIATNIGSGTHTIELRYEHLEDYNSGYPTTSYTNRNQALVVRAIGVDPSASLAAYSPNGASAGKLLAIGDSITRGWRADINRSSGNAYTTIQRRMSESLGYDYSCIAYNGWGLITTGSVGGAGAAIDSWTNYSSGRSRLSGGLLIEQPDMVVMNLGYNDSVYNNLAQQTAAVLAMLNDIRAKCTSAKIIVIVPLSQALAQAINDAFTTFADSNSSLIDLGTFGTVGIEAYTAAGTLYSDDGIHPDALNNARLASRAIRTLTKKMAKIYNRISFA